MQKIKKIILISSLLCSGATLAQKPIETTLGIESYHETYREYQDGQRFMQQVGQMNGFNAAVKYHFNENHNARLEGRYAKGKIDYTGGENPSDENPEGTPYGSATQNNVPRRSYDVRGVYGYQQAISPRLTVIGEAGLGYRVLKDLSSRVDAEDYDRKNKTAYAQIGTGLKINLAHGFEFTPKISYNQGFYARQYSDLGDETITLKQRHARGLEVELPISKKFANHTKLSFTPFYRGWRVPTSATLSRVEKDENGDPALASYSEPKNYTHELGAKLQFTF